MVNEVIMTMPDFPLRIVPWTIYVVGLAYFLYYGREFVRSILDDRANHREIAQRESKTKMASIYRQTAHFATAEGGTEVRTYERTERLSVLADRALTRLVGECGRAGMTRAEIAAWLFDHPTGGNLTTVIRYVDDSARRGGIVLSTARRTPAEIEREWVIAPAMDDLRVVSNGRERTLKGNKYESPG